MNSVEHGDNIFSPVGIINPNLPPFSAGSNGHATRIGSGQVIAEKFRPPRESDMPQTLFPLRIGLKAVPAVRRFIRRTDETQVLIYTDGACLGNGSENPKAGCAFVYRTSTQVPRVVGSADFRVENKGPTGQPHRQTSNRAELRAVIGAQRFRHWKEEGFDTLVIATDSEYVVEVGTSWVRGWLRNGWKTRTGAPVQNKDLWQCLLGEFERSSDRGMEIKFWQIPREWNMQADRCAKDVAAEEDCPNEFTDIMGVLV